MEDKWTETGLKAKFPRGMCTPKDERLGRFIWWHKIVLYFVLSLVCAIGLGIGLNRWFPPEI